MKSKLSKLTAERSKLLIEQSVFSVLEQQETRALSSRLQQHRISYGKYQQIERDLQAQFYNLRQQLQGDKWELINLNLKVNKGWRWLLKHADNWSISWSRVLLVNCLSRQENKNWQQLNNFSFTSASEESLTNLIWTRLRKRWWQHFWHNTK